MAYLAFSGSFEHSLDGKGRVIIPASFREALGENFTITINPTRTAVAIYPKEMWDGQLERLSHINPMDKIGLQYERYLMSVSFSGNSMDAQGRVLIPAKLRAKIGLTRDIVFVGLNSGTPRSMPGWRRRRRRISVRWWTTFTRNILLESRRTAYIPFRHSALRRGS